MSGSLAFLNMLGINPGMALMGFGPGMSAAQTPQAQPSPNALAAQVAQAQAATDQLDAQNAQLQQAALARASALAQAHAAMPQPGANAPLVASGAPPTLANAPPPSLAGAIARRATTPPPPPGPNAPPLLPSFLTGAVNTLTHPQVTPGEVPQNSLQATQEAQAAAQAQAARIAQAKAAVAARSQGGPAPVGNPVEAAQSVAAAKASNMPLPPTPPAGGPPGASPSPQAPAATTTPIAPVTSPTGTVAPTVGSFKPVTNDDGYYGHISSAESNNNPAAINPTTGAFGAYQMLTSTFGDFLKSSANTGHWTTADMANPAAQHAAEVWYKGQSASALKSAGYDANYGQLGLAHLFGAQGAINILNAAKANPNTPIMDVLDKTVGPQQAQEMAAGNPTIIRPGDTVGETMAKTSSFYHLPLALAGGASSGTASAGESAKSGSSSTTLDPTLILGQALSSIKNFPSILGNMATTLKGISPSAAAQMQSLAAGLLSGSSFANGLGRGFQNMQNLDQAARANALQGGNIAATNAERAVGMQSNALYRAMLMNNNQGYRAQVLGEKYAALGQRNTVDEQKLAQAEERLAQTEPGHAAMQKDNAALVKTVNDSANTARQGLRQIANFESTMNTAATGPEFTARLKRTVAQAFGISLGNTNINNVDLAKLFAGQMQTTGIDSINRTNVRNQREWDFITAGIPTLDKMRPEEARIFLQHVQNYEQYQVDLARKLDNNPQLIKSLNKDPMALNRWLQQQGDEYDAAHPLTPEYRRELNEGPMAGGAPVMAQAAGAQAAPTAPAQVAPGSPMPVGQPTTVHTSAGPMTITIQK